MTYFFSTFLHRRVVSS